MWKEIRQTIHLGWPIVLGNITQLALGIIDQAMVGAIHSSQLAAASFVNNLIAIPMIMGLGLTMAISPLVAMAQGSGEDDGPLRILYNGWWVIGTFGVIMALILTLGINMVYYMGQDQIVADLAKPYLWWMGIAIIPMVLFVTTKQFADGLGKTRIAMYITLSSLPINVLLNYAFIYGYWGAPRMELEGAGVGTLFTRILTTIAIVYIVFNNKGFAKYRQHVGEQLRFSWDKMKDIFKLGIPAGMQYGMESAAFAVSGIMAGWLGYIQQASHQIALSLAALTFMVSLGISNAGSIRVAYAFGRKDWVKTRQIGSSTLIMAVIYGLISGTILILGRHYFPTFFNEEAPVLEFATILLIMAAIFQVSDSVQAVGVGLCRGVQDVNIPTLFVSIAYWIFGVPGGYVLAFYFGLEIAGIWIGLIIGLSISAVLLTLRFLRITRKGKVKPMREEETASVRSLG